MLLWEQPTDPPAAMRGGDGGKLCQPCFVGAVSGTGPKPVVKVPEQRLKFKLCHAGEVDRVHVTGTLGRGTIR